MGDIRRPASAETPFTAGPGFAAPRYEPARYEPPSWTVETAGRPVDPSARTAAVSARVSGLLDRAPDETGPLVEPEWWSYATSDHPQHPLTARHSSETARARRLGHRAPTTTSPAPRAPLGAAPADALGRLGPAAVPPRGAGRRRPTVAQPLVPRRSRRPGDQWDASR